MNKKQLSIKPEDRAINKIKLFLLACCFIAFMQGPLTVVAADDDYLKALSEEAGNLEYLNQAKTEIRKSEEEEKVSSNASTSEPLDIDQFEKKLEAKSPASYTIYTELSTQLKLDVYTTYKSTRKFSATKKKIVELYLDI